MKKMKAKSLLLGALATGLLASCSDDRVTGTSSLANGGEITYSAVANKATRATALYNPNNLPTSFYVWAALTDGSAYISGDEVQGSDGVYTDVNGTHYWPSGALDFYATNCDTITTLDVTSAAPTIAYSVASTAATQLDLLYAVELGQTKGTTGVVALNFRHALSQIVFKAENDDANLYVEITGVGVNNVAGTGTFTFPSASTKENVPTSTGPYPEDGSVGAWDVGTYSGTAGTNASYSIACNAALAATIDASGTTTPATADLTTVTNTDASGTTTADAVSNALLLLPQEIAVGQTHNDAAYLTLECAIYNVAGEAYAEGDEELYNGTVYFPVAIAWEPGMKYTYNFVFGGTSSGGDGYGEDENDQPVLVPITYTVDVDEFVEVDAINEEVIASRSNDHEYVDLGLDSGLLWATCNVGAESPADYGDYYAWGEIKTKDLYRYDNSILYEQTEYDGTEITEDNIKGNPEFDAATSNWGSPWRMPTEAEMSELVENCDLTPETKTNSAGEEVFGYTLTGKNGNSIFFPAAGNRLGDEHLDAGSSGFYWSCTPYSINIGSISIPYSASAYYLQCHHDNNDEGSVKVDGNHRYYGYSVRPVRDKE